MATWLESIMSPLNAAGESIQKLVDIRDTVKFGETVGKIYAQVLAAQQAALMAQAREASLLDEIGGLKKRVSELEAWNAEKDRYELVSLAPNLVAFAVKQSARGDEPMHYICANCYNGGKKSFLQQVTRGAYHDAYKCNACGEHLSVNKGMPPIDYGRQGGRGPQGWMR